MGKYVKRQRKGRDLNLTSPMFQTILTNYKKLKKSPQRNNSINRKPEKQMKIFPSFFTSYSSFIRKPVRLFPNIQLNMALCVCIKARKSALPQQKTRQKTTTLCKSWIFFSKMNNNCDNEINTKGHI